LSINLPLAAPEDASSEAADWGVKDCRRKMGGKEKIKTSSGLANISGGGF
jgi:hypothetical protein